MNSESNTITPFAFGDHLIRIIDQNGDPWFVAKDVCRSIGLRNVGMALRPLDKDEVNQIDLIDSLGRSQATNVVSESGLYALIIRSDKPAARSFRKWITAEILPQLRRTGSYLSAQLREEITALRQQVEDLQSRPPAIEDTTPNVENLSLDAADFVLTVHSLIQLGTSPDAACKAAIRQQENTNTVLRAARRLSPPQRSSTPQPWHGLKSSIIPADVVLDLMEPGRYYDIDELLSLLPEEHPIHHRDTPRGRQSSMGKLMHLYKHFNRVDSHEVAGRTRYRSLRTA
jgi:prophage antirepressor-like protein